MEWVETTAKTVQEAKDHALDRLGVADDEAEFEVLEEPKTGLFGRVRGEARVRARVKPAAVRPKQDRRARKTKKRDESPRGSGRGANDRDDTDRDESDRDDLDDGRRSDEPLESGEELVGAATGEGSSRSGRPRSDRSGAGRTRSGGGRSPGSRGARQDDEQSKEDTVESEYESNVSPDEVGQAAVAFMSGLATAFGSEAAVELSVEGVDLEVRVQGNDLGLLVGPGGRTLAAVQDLARVASQRRLGDHETRLKIDVAGYRERRRVALEQFTRTVAQKVIESDAAVAMEPMSSSDRKVVHDTVVGIDGVTSRSEGEDPSRRVVITPA